MGRLVGNVDRCQQFKYELRKQRIVWEWGRQKMKQFEKKIIISNFKNVFNNYFEKFEIVIKNVFKIRNFFLLFFHAILNE